MSFFGEENLSSFRNFYNPDNISILVPFLVGLFLSFYFTLDLYMATKLFCNPGVGVGGFISQRAMGTWLQMVEIKGNGSRSVKRRFTSALVVDDPELVQSQ